MRFSSQRSSDFHFSVIWFTLGYKLSWPWAYMIGSLFFGSYLILLGIEMIDWARTVRKIKEATSTMDRYDHLLKNVKGGKN